MTQVQDLIGTFVVEVGERQAWPFVTFCDNAATPSREIRLYIDTEFAVDGSSVPDAESVDPTVRLLPLNGRSVVATEVSGGELSIAFDEGARIAVSGVATAMTSGDVWWLGPWDRRAAVEEVIRQLIDWRDVDRPMVEAIGDAIAACDRFDSQEQARRILDAVIDVLAGHADSVG